MMKYIFYQFIFIFSVHAIQVSEFSDKDNMLIDFNDDEKVDVVTSQKGGKLTIFYLDNNEKKKIIFNKSKRVFAKDFYTFDRAKKSWVMTRKDTLEKINEEDSVKRIDYFLPKRDVKVFTVSNYQNNETRNRFLMPQPWQYLSGSTLSIEDQEIYMSYRGDSCKVLQLRQIGENLEERLGRRLFRRFRRINLSSFFELENCQGPCASPVEGNHSRIVGRGRRKKLQCLDETSGEITNEISCNASFSKLINRGLKKKITCLSRVNKSLAAQVIGLITSNNLGSADPDQCPASLPRNGRSKPNCTKIKIKCLNDPDHSLDFFGRAGLPSSRDWPSMKILPPQCQAGGESVGIEDAVDTLLHETIHLLGYSHDEIPDPAYACSFACRRQVVGRDERSSVESDMSASDESSSWESAKEAASRVCSMSDSLNPEISFDDYFQIIGQEGMEDGGMRLAYENFIGKNLFVTSELVSSGISDIFNIFILPKQQKSTVCANPSSSSRDCFNDVLDKMINWQDPDYSYGENNLVVSLALFGQNYQPNDEPSGEPTIGIEVILNDFLGSEGHRRMKSLGTLIRQNNEAGLLEFFSREKTMIEGKFLSRTITADERVIIERERNIFDRAFLMYCRAKFIAPSISTPIRNLCRTIIRKRGVRLFSPE